MTRLRSLRIATFIAIALGSTASAADEPLRQVPAQRVLAVKVDGRDGYAAAFGRLVGFYLKHRVQVIFPQMSLEADGTSLAAIAFDGNATADSDVTIMTLPAALVAVQPHIGPYGTLSQSIAKTIDAAQQWGCTPDTSRYLRLLHRNSPDDTPADKLVTEIQIPVTGCRS